MTNEEQSYSFGQNLRDETLTIRDWEQKVETRPTLERVETFETKCLQNVTNFLTLNFGQWAV